MGLGPFVSLDTVCGVFTAHGWIAAMQKGYSAKLNVPPTVTDNKRDVGHVVSYQAFLTMCWC